MSERVYKRIPDLIPPHSFDKNGNEYLFSYQSVAPEYRTKVAVFGNTHRSRWISPANPLVPATDFIEAFQEFLMQQPESKDFTHFITPSSSVVLNAYASFQITTQPNKSLQEVITQLTNEL